jgi:DNA-binding NarL/FixJ family response regulator
MATLLLVDSAALRRALRENLHQEPGVRIVGEAGSLARAARLAERLQPDIVLLDAEMADLDPLAALATLRHAAPNSELIVVSIEPDRVAQLARGQDAVHVVGKVDGTPALLVAVRRASASR